MKKFLLSQNITFPFKLFGVQHILMLIVTSLLFVGIYLVRNKFKKLSKSSLKKLRLGMAIFIFTNMFIYRISYMIYGVYDIRIHLSLYYCHIINYLFVISLFFNYTSFYKVIYGLAWIGVVWGIIVPDLSSGIDCFIFYSSFISHNLLLVFVTIVTIINNIKFKFLDCLKCMSYAIAMVGVTYLINIDFGTKYNNPSSYFGINSITNELMQYFLLIIVGFVGAMLGYFINLIFFKPSKKI